MSNRYWFRPKSLGNGAVPTTRQGWLFTFGAAAAIALPIVVAILAEMRRWPYRHLITAICMLNVAASFATTFYVARIKTDGEWQWRWHL